MRIYLSYSSQLRHMALRLDRALFIYFDGIKIAELIKGQVLNLDLPLAQGRLQVGYPRTEAGRILPYPSDYALSIDDCAWKSDVFIIDQQHQDQYFIVGSKTWLWFDILDLHQSMDQVLFIRLKQIQ